MRLRRCWTMVTSSCNARATDPDDVFKRKPRHIAYRRTSNEPVRCRSAIVCTASVRHFRWSTPCRSYRPLRKCSSASQEELMAATRTPGITILTDGRRFIDKRYLGVRIGLRVGAVTQEQAEERLDIEIARVQRDLARKAHARPTFTDCAARYVAQSRSKPSIDCSIQYPEVLRNQHRAASPLNGDVIAATE